MTPELTLCKYKLGDTHKNDHSQLLAIENETNTENIKVTSNIN
jgi:hypothetical protein